MVCQRFAGDNAKYNNEPGVVIEVQGTQWFHFVTKNTTIQAKLTGYKQTKSDAFSMGNKYQFYVLVEYPIGQANKALLNQIKQDEVLSTQKDADKAMADLEAEIEKRRKK